MKRKLLRLWYRITGQAAEAEYMLGLALMISFQDDGHGFELWKRDYQYIHDVMKDRKAE